MHMPVVARHVWVPTQKYFLLSSRTTFLAPPLLWEDHIECSTASSASHSEMQGFILFNIPVCVRAAIHGTRMMLLGWLISFTINPFVGWCRWLWGILNVDTGNTVTCFFGFFSTWRSCGWMGGFLSMPLSTKTMFSGTSVKFVVVSLCTGIFIWIKSSPCFLAF